MNLPKRPPSQYMFLKRALGQSVRQLQVEPGLLGPRLGTLRSGRFWLIVFGYALFLIVSTTTKQPALLMADLVVSGLLIASTAGAPWAILSLLVETTLLDHFTVPIANINVRPEWIVAAVAALYVGWTNRKSLANLRPSRTDIALCAWLALNGISSILFAPNRSASLKTWAGLLIAASVFFVIRPLVRLNLDAIFHFLFIIGAAACATAIIAYLLHPYGFPFGAQWNRDAGIFMAYGTLWEADILGSFAAALFVFWVGWTLWRPPAFRSLHWLIALLAVLALEISLGRGAWVATIVTLILSLPLWWKLRDRFALPKWGPATSSLIAISISAFFASGILWFVIGVTRASTSGPQVTTPSLGLRSSPMTVRLAVLRHASGASDRLGAATIPQALVSPGPTPASTEPTTSASRTDSPSLLKRLGSLLSPEKWADDPTVAGRLALARLAIHDWQHEPLFGLGPGSFGEAHIDSSHQPAWIANIWLRALHDTGIVGLLLLIAFFVGLVVKGLRLVWQGAGPSAFLAAALLMPVACIWIAAQATEPFQLMWPWLFLGFLASAQTVSPDLPPAELDAAPS